MKPRDTAWMRLSNAARQAPDSPDDKAPFGFSTRVAALAMTRPASRPPWQVSLGFASWRALGVALTLMLLSILANYSATTSVADTDQDTIVDPVGDVLASS